MEPSREIFWNIPFGWLVYPLAFIAVVVLAYGVYWRILLWKIGKPENRVDQLSKRVWTLITGGIADVLGHRRFLRDSYPGIMHLLLFWGAVALLITTFLDVVSHYFFEFLIGTPYLTLSVVSDSLGILFVVGIIIATIRRYIQRPKRLDNTPQDAIALLLIFFILITGFVVEGLRLAASELINHPDWAVWSPGGWLLGQAFSGLSVNTLLPLHQVMWWFHTVLVLGTFVYVGLTFTKLTHILSGLANLFFRSLRPKGALVPIDIEKSETFGVSKIEDFTWKQLFDGDCCTRCGRCQDNCPAYLSGKPLSPKKVTIDLKEHLLKLAPSLLAKKEIDKRPDMVSEVITDEVIWECTTCRACQEACPVYIEHIQKLIDMRRHLVLERAQVPETALNALRSIESRGHPWRGTTLARTDWTKGLGVKVMAEDKAVDILYWVGCTAALEDRNIKVAIALAKVLQQAGVKFGILGDEETCCGEPARRLGNEYLFQMLAQKNIETFKNYGVKKIIASCPHCFNTIKNEYPQFGGEFEVLHHSQFLSELLSQGKLQMGSAISGKATYHDSCYLGRYNDIFEPPRKLLKGLPGLKLVEMGRRRYKGFCCGGGGGRLWQEETIGQRINRIRTQEALDTGAQMIATACPFCLQMFEEGVKALNKEETVKALDIAEITLLSYGIAEPAVKKS